MEPSLFQLNITEVLASPKPFGISDARVTTYCAWRESQRPFGRTLGANLLEIGRTIVGVNPFWESFSMKHAILGLALFLIATPTLGQSLASRSSQSSPQAQASVEINPRLQQARENLAGSTTESQTSESRIGPDDLLNISIFEAPEMNCSVRVSASGEISLQLLGPVHASGLTPRELDSILKGLLHGTYMKDPHDGGFIQGLR